MQMLRRQLLVHRRTLHRCRCNEVGGDSVRRQLECDVAGKLIHGRLCDPKVDHAVTRMARRLGSEIEQTAIATRSHARDNSFGEKECGMQLSVQLSAELL